MHEQDAGSQTGSEPGRHQGAGTIDVLIEPRRRPVGDGEVDRLLPFRRRRMVGPFVYADLIGPDPLRAGVGIDVPAHPHIGLSTVTYLFEGALMHRDSTGAVQRIEPGGVNWMTAGSGVAHSERSPDDERAGASTIAGLQTWVALPDDAEEMSPSFQHVGADEVPQFAQDDATVRLLAGTHGGHRSPVRVASPLFHVSVELAHGGSWSLAGEHAERAVLVIDGAVTVAGVPVPPRHLAVLAGGTDATVVADGPARLMAFGGEPVGDRSIAWNFVSSSRDRIRRAEEAWRAGDWPAVPGDPERIELPPRA